MPPTSELRLDGRRVRVEVDGEPRWGRREGDTIALDDGSTVAEQDAAYLAPVEPSKILAVHLTYRSRVEEYAARTPGRSSRSTSAPRWTSWRRTPGSSRRSARGSCRPSSR